MGTSRHQESRLIAAAALLLTTAAVTAAADAPGLFPPATAPRAEGPRPPGEDPFQPKTVWQGTTGRKQTYRFVIQERAGDTFKGSVLLITEKVAAPKPKVSPLVPSRSSAPPAVKVEGTIKNGELSFEPLKTTAQPQDTLAYRGKYEQGVLQLTATVRGGAPTPPQNPRRPPARPAPAPEPFTGEFTFKGNSYATFPDLYELQRPLTATDPKVVAREIAQQMSFPLFSLDRRLQPLNARLWLPYRSKTFGLSQGGYPEAESAVRQRLDALVATAPGGWRSAALDARLVLTSRLKLARFNQQLGNTPDASLSRDLPKYMFGWLEAANDFNRKAQQDQAAGRREWSDETKRAAEKFASKANPNSILDSIRDESQAGKTIPPPLKVTRYMTAADIRMAEEQSQFWAEHLIPALEGAKLPKASGPLVTVEPVWAAFDQNASQGLSMTAYKNVSGGPLTNVVLALRLENEYREVTTTYHYVEHWAADAVLRAAPHPAWGGERTYHMGRFTGHLSVWSDQGQAVRQGVSIVNTKLTARARVLRREWTDLEAEVRDKSMLMGGKVVSWFELPPLTKP